MEHINIISKEAITQPVQWPFITVGIITIIIVVITGVISGNKSANKDYEDSNYWSVRMLVSGFSGIAAMLATLIVCAIFFRVPTGEYEYKATVDKENITVSEYEEFLDEYKPTVEDGIYSWIGD